MKLDINEIYHQYIIRMIVFSLFLYKGQIRQPGVYKQSIYSFLKRRVPWSINLRIDFDSLSKEDNREVLLEDLFNGVKYEPKIRISFTSPLKDTTMDIDISKESKYQEFLYK